MRYSIQLSKFEEENFSSKEIIKMINSISTYKSVPNYFNEGELRTPLEVLSDFFYYFVHSEKFKELAEDEELVRNLFFRIYELSDKNVIKVVEKCQYAPLVNCLIILMVGKIFLVLFLKMLFIQNLAFVHI